MEFITSLPKPLVEDQNQSEITFSILKQQSSNVKRNRSATDKQQNNSSNTYNIIQVLPQKSCHQLQPEVNINNEQLQQPLLSVDVSVIDQRDDLLLSTTTVEDHLLSDQTQSICQLHDKPQDIICLVEKKKICSYCALFGHHKDHIFKSEQQLCSEIEKKAKQLQQLETHFVKMRNSVIQKTDLTLMKESHKNKIKQILKEVQHEYSEIIDKLKQAKADIENKIEEESNEVIKKIEEEWQQVEIDINGCRLFQDWKQCGIQVLKTFKDALKSSSVEEGCAAFQHFPWGKGQSLIKASQVKLQDFEQIIQKQISSLNHLSNYSLKNAIAASLSFDLQSITSLHLENSVPSIQQLHNINTNQTIKFHNKTTKKNEVMNFNQQKQKFRHSEFLQSTLKPIRQSLQLDPRQSRNSTYGLMNKRKSEDINKSQWNASTVLQRFKSNNRNDQTFLSPKIRPGMCRSPRQTTPKQNPHKIVAQFEKNMAQNSLNLSNCGLEDESVLYFIQKAFSSHIPYEINLHKNSISSTGLSKLIPYFLKVQVINLANTGLNEGCLQVFSKIKGFNRLEEVNLLQNGISLHKNKMKIEILRKSGLKVICQ